MWPFNRKPPTETKSLAEPDAELLAILGASQLVTQYVLSPAAIEATLQAAG